MKLPEIKIDINEKSVKAVTNSTNSGTMRLAIIIITAGLMLSLMILCIRVGAITKPYFEYKKEELRLTRESEKTHDNFTGRILRPVAGQNESAVAAD